MRTLLKIGGAALERTEARTALAASIASARAAGHEIVVLHGGGNQIRSLSAGLGIEAEYLEGLRVTDGATAEVVLAAVAGTVGKHLVASLGAAGVAAIGLCGADASLFQVSPHPDRRLGYVGLPVSVNGRALEALLAAGLLPCVGCVAPLAPDAEGPRDHLYNVNADDVALPLAKAFGAEALLFLTDVPAVLDSEGERIVELDGTGAEALRSDGVIAGGMIPKVRAGLDAATALPETLVKIAPAAGPDAVLAALSDDVGTTFHP